MEELLLAVAKGLVEDKDAVKVTVDEANEDGIIVYHLTVAEDDMGRQGDPRGHACCRRARRHQGHGGDRLKYGSAANENGCRKVLLKGILRQPFFGFHCFRYNADTKNVYIEYSRQSRTYPGNIHARRSFYEKTCLCRRAGAVLCSGRVCAGAGRFFRLRAILFRRSLLPAAGFRHGRTGSAAFGPSL